MKELKIIEKYRPLLILDIASVMADNSINIVNINTYNIGDLVVISMLFQDNDYNKAIRLAKSRWNVVTDPNSLIVELEDKPGQLAKLAKLLSENNIELKSTNVVNKIGNKTYVMLVTSDNEAAKSILQKEFNVS